MLLSCGNLTLTKPPLVLGVSSINNSERWLRSGFGKMTVIAFSPSQVVWVLRWCFFHNDAPELPVPKEHGLKGVLALAKFSTLENVQDASCLLWTLVSVPR